MVMYNKVSMMYKKVIKYCICLYGIGLPFQWIYLENPLISGVNTILFVFFIACYKGWIK